MLKRELPVKAPMEFEASLGLNFPETEPVVRDDWHKKLSVCEPRIGDSERASVERVMSNGWISSLGPEVKAFESAFAEKVGTKFAVSCSNGTAALHLALATLGIGPGDEVIIPTFTMIASVNAVLYCGATPVLVDCDEHLNMDVEQVRLAVTPRTKCIMPVHIYGYPCNMAVINQIAEEYNLWVVEDVAESHGARYGSLTTGAIGDIGAFSCYANKIITTGEGGVLTTNEQEIADRIRTLMNHAFSPERHFCHRLPGFNYRMTALQAALGTAQTKDWDKLIYCRQQVEQWYVHGLKGRPDLIEIPNLIPEKGLEPVCWMFGIMVDRNKKNALRKRLAEVGIETRSFFVPMHLQPVLYERFKGQRFPKSELAMERGLYLPTSSELTHSEVRYICESLLFIMERELC